MKTNFSSRLNALGSFFFVVFGLMVVSMMVASTALASAPFNDDFESYTQGTCSLGICGAWNSGTVVNTPVHGGAQSWRAPGTATLTPQASGEWYFWIYKTLVPTYYGGQYPLRWYLTGSGSPQFDIYFSQKDNSYVNTFDVVNGDSWAAIFTDVSVGAWHQYGVKWSVADGIELNLDGGAWVYYKAFYGAGWDTLGFTEAYNDVYVDDITGATPPVINGYDPILTPSAPPDGATTQVNLSNISLTGNLQIPTGNPYIWQYLTVDFLKSGGLTEYQKQITLPTMTIGGTSTNYSATTTIAVSADYQVFYVLQGYDQSNNQIVTFNYVPPKTYITPNATLTPPVFPVVTLWVPPTLADCSGLDVIQTIVCNIQNTLLGMIIPTADSVNNLLLTFQQFQQKFPFSYVSAITTTLSNIRTGLNESATISIKVFGQSGNVSLAFWNSAVTIAGVATTIGAVLKLILTFFLLLIFLFWGIGYLHRFV